MPVLFLMFKQGFLSEFRSSKAEIHLNACDQPSFLLRVTCKYGDILQLKKIFYVHFIDSTSFFICTSRLTICTIWGKNDGETGFGYWDIKDKRKLPLKWSQDCATHQYENVLQIMSLAAYASKTNKLFFHVGEFTIYLN